MADYAFVTAWRLEAPIERVYDAIADSLRWPQWWDAVLAVEEIRVADHDGTGNVRRYTFRGRLPYLLRFDLTTDVVDRPTRLGGVAEGELEGRGDWRLEPDGEATLVRYDWRIRTTRPWMNALAPLPFVRAIFVLNHDFVMRRGLIGIRQDLGISGREIDPALVAPATGPAG
jgi:Polyketide cyclase / dehydrase and lipid transport